MEGAGGVGLVEGGGGTHDDVEAPVGEEGGDALAGEVVGLVGEDGELEVAPREGGEEFGDAGVGAGLGVPAVLVFGAVGGGDAVMVAMSLWSGGRRV